MKIRTRKNIYLDPDVEEFLETEYVGPEISEFINGLIRAFIPEFRESDLKEKYTAAAKRSTEQLKEDYERNFG